MRPGLVHSGCLDVHTFVSAGLLGVCIESGDMLFSTVPLYTQVMSTQYKICNKTLACVLLKRITSMNYNKSYMIQCKMLQHLQ